VIKNGNKEPSKSTSWKVLETVMSHLKAVNQWATEQCEKEGFTVHGATKRRILREKNIKGIRFPIMRQEDFATVVLDR